MKKITLILFISFMFNMCHEKEVNNYTSHLIKGFSKKTQKITFNATEGGEFTCNEGTIIKIQPNSFFNEGEGVIGKILLEVTEFYEVSDILLNDLVTMSNGKILETGGMLNIRAFLNGNQLKLKDDKPIIISFPKKIIDKKGMKLFNGVLLENDSVINWIENKDDFNDTDYNMERYLDVDSILSIEELKRREELKSRSLDYYIFESSKLGWLNCDKFINVSNLANVNISFEPTLKPVIRIVLKDMNSVMIGKLNNNSSIRFNPPLGQKATLFGFSKVDDKIYIATKDLMLNSNLNIKLEFRESSIDEILVEASKLTWN